MPMPLLGVPHQQVSPIHSDRVKKSPKKSKLIKWDVMDKYNYLLFYCLINKDLNIELFLSNCICKWLTLSDPIKGMNNV